MFAWDQTGWQERLPIDNCTGSATFSRLVPDKYPIAQRAEFPELLKAHLSEILGSSRGRRCLAPRGGSSYFCIFCLPFLNVFAFLVASAHISISQHCKYQKYFKAIFFITNWPPVRNCQPPEHQPSRQSSALSLLPPPPFPRSLVWLSAYLLQMSLISPRMKSGSIKTYQSSLSQR